MELRSVKRGKEMFLVDAYTLLFLLLLFLLLLFLSIKKHSNARAQPNSIENHHPG